jgi:hypothetical protein
VPPIPVEVFNGVLEDRAWVTAQGTIQSLATFAQRLELLGGIRKIRDVRYVLATDFPASPFPQFYEKAQARSWRTYTVACGHDVMLARPKEIADILLDAAG